MGGGVTWEQGKVVRGKGTTLIEYFEVFLAVVVFHLSQ